MGPEVPVLLACFPSIPSENEKVIVKNFKTLEWYLIIILRKLPKVWAMKRLKAETIQTHFGTGAYSLSGPPPPAKKW